MPEYYYILLNKTPAQLRRLGARGGKAQARNRRVRLRPRAPLQPNADLDLQPETAAQAIAALDAQFPWLRGAEKRTAPAPPQLAPQLTPSVSLLPTQSTPAHRPASA